MIDALALVHRAPPRRPDGDLQPAGVEVVGSICVAAASGGDDRGLVEQVGQHARPRSRRSCARAPRGRRRRRAACSGRGPRGSSRRPFTSGSPTWILRLKRPGPEDGRVEDVEPVRRGDDDDVVGRAEAVELDEQLVERLLALLVAVRAAAGLADARRTRRRRSRPGRACGPGRTGRGCAARRRRRTSRRTPSPTRSGTGRRPRRRPRGRASSCRCRAGRRA